MTLASHRYFPVPGGTERIVQTIAEGLVQRGWQATVVTQQEPEARGDETLHGVRVVRLPMRVAFGIRWPKGYIRTLRDNPGEVFHLHGNRIWCADFYFPRARAIGWPQVLTGHGFYQWAMHPRAVDRWYFRRYLPKAIQRFDAYAALTVCEQEQLLSWGVPAEKVVRIPNGVRLDEFAGGPETRAQIRERWGVRADHLLVYVGGFFENKRIDRLIDAVAAAESRWAILAVGRDVPESPYSVNAMARRASGRGVEFHTAGVLDRPSTVRTIQGADVVGLASEYEGFGVSLLEAMAAGRAFVSWNVGAGPELAARGAGISVGSIDSFARALDALSDSGTRLKMGEAGRRAVVDYSEERMVERYMELYTRIADASAGPPSRHAQGTGEAALPEQVSNEAPPTASRACPGSLAV